MNSQSWRPSSAHFKASRSLQTLIIHFWDTLYNETFRGFGFLAFLARARCRSTCAAVSYAATTSCTALFVTAPCNVRIMMIMMMVIMTFIVQGDVPCGRCCRRWEIGNDAWTRNIACNKDFDHILIKIIKTLLLETTTFFHSWFIPDLF